MSPHRSGAIILFDRPWKQWKVIMAFPTGEKVPADTLEWLMQYAREHSIPLLFYTNLKENGKFKNIKRTGYGPPAFVHEAKTQIDPVVDVFSLPGK